jgi:hypothetical protein
MLEKELKIYEENKARLREENPSGGYVIIKDERIFGVWNDRQDALNAGIKEFGNVPFLVKEIGEKSNNINSFSRDILFVN